VARSGWLGVELGDAMVRGPQPLRADCDSGFLGVLGGSMVQSIDVFKVSIAFAIHSEGYLAYVKVPRDLSYDVYKPIDTRVQRE